ncbi:NAD(P)-binding protein [Cadophora sp. DSE1049]|nr:NAD(P)-binding protein [Cadophora sp. DSE1049]
MEVPLKLFTTLGIASTSLFTLKALRFIYTYIHSSSIMRYHHLQPLTSRPPWALITGSSDGIGKSYASLLASKGFNIILHGRNPGKLETLRQSMQEAHPDLDFRVLVLDASKDGVDANREIKDAVDSLKDLHVTVLINNVGGGEKCDGPFMEPYVLYTTRDIDRLLNVNARFPAQITRAVLPLLKKHGGPALIMTMGSMSDFGMPYMSVYSAAKAFDLTFSTALKRELDAEGRTMTASDGRKSTIGSQIEVLGIMTGGVTEVAWDKTKGNLFRPAAETLAKAALERVGCGRDVVAAYLPHALIWPLPDLLPKWLFESVLLRTSQMEMRHWRGKWEGLKKKS